MLLPEFDGFTTGARFADHCHVRFVALDHSDQTLAHDAMVIGDKDPDANLWRARARGVSPDSSRGGDMAPFRARIHNTSSGFKGNIAVTVVPLPRYLTIFNSPPISSARSPMPVRPTPSCRSLIRNPLPSSRSSSPTSFALDVQ